MASLLLLLVAATAALAAPPPLSGRAAQAELTDTIPGGSGPTLAELAAAQGLQPPPRRSPRVARHAPRVGRAALDGLGASASPYPFGLADPEPPRRYKEPSSVPDEILAQAEFEDADLLPARVVPTRYTVQMAPQIEKGTFYGSTDIYLNVVEATSQIILHAVDINVKEVQIFLYSPDFEKYFGYGEARIYPQASGSHRLVIQLTRELQPGDHYLLRFPLFAANLRDDLQGFYLSSYKDAKGATRYLATTQFQPPAARYAFPCIDEPAAKARFKIIVEHDVSMHARSNMPAVRRTRPTLTTIRTEFDQTVPMSTYLLAWIVSDFVDLPSSDSSIITWGRPNLITSTTAFLGSRAAPLALRKLEEFTGIAYVLPKVDQYAIPDFAAGAMENWGLVTYGEQYLLETDETNIAIRQFIGTTVCHELGHQWTGNLVTLDWWSNTWLNEGFATYFESVICDQVFPEWKLLDKYVTDNTHVAIANDIYPDQLAMSSPVHSIPAIEAKFDRISYKKGGAVVRMFEFILGTEVFKKGMLRYLSAYSFSYGTPDRLFRSFNAEAKLAGSLLPDGVSFADMAKTWTEQNGVPVVTALRDYKSSTVTLSQEQFLYQRPKSHVDNLWYIPVPVEANPHSKEWTWSLEDAPANRRWLTPAAPSMTRDVDASATEWIVINPKQIGYYLVNYDEANWELLRTALTEPRPLIPASSRAQLLHDALALARAGRLRYALALPILHSLKREREAAPWKAGVQALAFLRDRLGATPAGDVLKVFIKQLTSDAHSDLGFSPSKTVAESYKDLQTDEERLVRYYVSSYACYARNEQCIKAASQQFAAAIKNTETKIHPDVKQTALCYAVQNSAEHFAEALAKWESETDFAAISEWSQVLSCTLDHSLLQKILDDILSGKVNKSSMHFQILIGALVTRWENHDFLVKFYKANWKKIDQLVGDNFHLELLTVLIRDIRTTADYVDMMTFIMAAFPDGNSLERLEATARLEAVYEDLEWYRKYYTVVSEWLYAATNTKPQVSTEAPTQKPPPQPTQGTTPRPIMTTPQGVPSTTPSSSSHTTSTISLLAMSALALLLSL